MNQDLIVMPYGNCRVLRSAGYGHPLAAGVGANIRGDGTTDGIGMGMEDLGFRVLQLGGPSDYDGDGIPDEEDWDDDEDGFNDWLEEIIGTDPLDEDDVPDLDNIEGTCISIIENLALDVGVEKSFITQIEKLRQSAEDVMKSINQSSQLSNRIESLYNSGQITYDDLRTLESLVMKFLPLKEGVYSYRLEDGYIIHDFLFNQAQMIEMSESAYKAQPYANWMIDKIWTIADGWGANIGRLVGRFTLAFSISNMANESLREGWSDMHVEIRSSSNEEMKWALEFLDTIVDKWKTLAIGM
jgi:hypothetical protein